MSPGRLSTCSRRYSACLALVVLSALFRAGVAGAAEQFNDGTWQLDTYVDLIGATTYFIKDGKTTTLPVLGAEIGAELWAADKSFSTGVYAGIESEPVSHGEDIRFAGTWAKYRHLRWEVVTAVAYVEMGSSGNFWMHASKLRFRPRSGHKLSIEALNVVGDASRPAYQLAYAVSLPRNVSLTFGVGFGSNRLFDFAGNAKLVWSLR